MRSRARMGGEPPLPSNRVGPDVAIMGSSNSGAMVMLQRVGAACERIGLRTELLKLELGARSTASKRADPWPAPPLRPLSSEADLEGVFAYPSPVSMIRLLPQVAAELTRLSPRAIVTHVDSYGIFRLLHWWAAANGRPGFVVQEGAAPVVKGRGAAGLPPARWSTRGRAAEATLASLLLPSLFQPRTTNTVAEKACVWGPAMVRFLEAEGRPPEQTVVTGNPGMDHVRGQRPLVGGGAATVLFAHQFLPDEEVELGFCRKLVDVCANRIGCRLLFRPHPRSRLRRSGVLDLVAEVTPHKERVVVADEGEITDWLEQASLLVTFYSASIYPSILAGVPVLLADWPSPDLGFDLDRYGAGSVVRDSAAFEGSLRRMLWDEAARRSAHEGGGRLIEDQLYRLDGGAAARVAAEIAKACGRC